MAKKVVTECDATVSVKVSACGQEHEDTRTFSIRVDGEAWEIDLGGPHAEALLQIARSGRQLDGGIRRLSDTRALDRRIRNAPTTQTD